MQPVSSADNTDAELQHVAATNLPSNKRQQLADAPTTGSEVSGVESEPELGSDERPPSVLSSPAGVKANEHGTLSNDDGDGDGDDDDDDDDDLLVVKRRDVLSDTNAALAAEGGVPLGGVELRGNKKRKKLKINPGRTSGARTVFDEAGESLQPLALLAQEQLDRSACPPCQNTICWLLLSSI